MNVELLFCVEAKVVGQGGGLVDNTDSVIGVDYCLKEDILDYLSSVCEEFMFLGGSFSRDSHLYIVSFELFRLLLVYSADPTVPDIKLPTCTLAFTGLLVE